MRKLDYTNGRVCKQCGIAKPPLEFSWKDGTAHKRLTARCRACIRSNYKENPVVARERAAAYYRENRAAVSIKGKSDRRKRIAKHLWMGARSRAKENNLPFTISESDVIVPTYCPVLGVELTVGDGKCGPQSPTIDRIKPELGYIPGNIIVISFRANTIKSDATIQELEKVVNFYRALAVALTAEGKPANPALAMPQAKILELPV